MEVADYVLWRLWLVLGAGALLYGAAARTLWNWRRRARARRAASDSALPPRDFDPDDIRAAARPGAGAEGGAFGGAEDGFSLPGDDEPVDVAVAVVDGRAADAAGGLGHDGFDLSDPAWLDASARRPAPGRVPARAAPGPVGWLVLAAAAAGLAATGWALWRAVRVEPYRLDVVHVYLPLEQMRGKPELTIAQVSDLHGDGVDRVESALPQAVADLNPDVVVFTGDLFRGGRRGAFQDDQAGRLIMKTMQRLAHIRPQASFASLGNHDIANLPGAEDAIEQVGAFNGDAADPLPPARRLTLPVSAAREPFGIYPPLAARHRELGGLDFRLLAGETVRYVAPSGVVVRFAGGGVYTAVHDEVALALERLDRVREPGDVTVLLGHYPSMRHAAAAHAVDLHLAGDTHNGQIVLPGIGPLARKTTRDGEWYENRLYAFPNPAGGRTRLYVNRGLGMDGKLGLSGRLNCTPEITLLHLVDPGGDYPFTPAREPAPAE